MIKLKDILQEIATNASPKKIGNWKANKLFNPNKENNFISWTNSEYPGITIHITKRNDVFEDIEIYYLSELGKRIIRKDIIKIDSRRTFNKIAELFKTKEGYLKLMQKVIPKVEEESKNVNKNKEKEQEEIAIENTKEGKKLEKVITKIMKSKIDPEIVDEYVSTIYHGGTPKNKKIDALGGTMIKDLIDALLNKDIESDEIDDFIADAMMNSQD